MRRTREFRKLAEGLPDVPSEKFDMEVWAAGRVDVESPGFECDYAGCAIGWMAKLVPENTLIPAGHYNPRCMDADGLVLLSGFNAIAEYFSISVRKAIYFFSPESYRDITQLDYRMQVATITPAEVSERMMKYLSGRKKVKK